ncbi:MAG TPA: methylenetetrahydrofolate reductase [NAD(P)H] [Gammaproteobacteria bacterium]|nr:methylenetetrahydrofolate reductase [NAD(P)H] [Gammaproteobacteria bacterium]
MTDNNKTTFSLEYFPPRSAKGEEGLAVARADLKLLNPAYVSVTFGAGGSTQDGTYATIKSIMENDGVDAAPHISCISTDRETLARMLGEYRELGVKRLVALRGDLPSGYGTTEAAELRYASDLVAFIREQTGDWFKIEVAAYPEFHPQARSAQDDLENFKRKAEAGADSAITQYFFNPDAYFRFIDSCTAMGIDIPVVPGIMPITNYKQLARFSDACGAEIPRWIRKRLEGYGDDLTSIRDFGFDVVFTMCERLLDAGAPGLHFYSMNRTEPTRGLWKALNLGQQI